ncbi:MAG: hypothetical protein IJL12_05330 [Selenomonadaceae bacterium]|nr:hypothetical protein [Selenomonadaceae bacterium]MBQ6131743.1 hypothetical protein [Selenomonadaceae bacterium]
MNAPQGNTPVRNISALDKIYRRTKRGTDVFVYGFNGEEYWAGELIGELIKNFLVAIYRDKLRIIVQGQAIDKGTLKNFVTEDAANYYKILTGDAAIKRFELPFHDMGTLKLGVLTASTAKLNRRVLIVRKSGMKLFELDRFARTLNFTAILELEGLKLNAFFRHMETPDHTNWEPSRHPTYPARAKKYLDELKRWVRDTISKLDEENISDEVEVTGVIAPNDGSDPNPPAIIKFNPTRKRKTLTRKPDKDKPKPPKPSTGEIIYDKVRVIKVGEKNYRLIVKVPRKISSGRIKISAVGESNAGEKLFVTQASSADSNRQAFAFGDKILFKNLRGKTDARINFELNDDKNYALGVAVYEDRKSPTVYLPRALF